MLKLRNLEKFFDTKAGRMFVLRRIDLDVRPGRQGLCRRVSIAGVQRGIPSVCRWTDAVERARRHPVTVSTSDQDGGDAARSGSTQDSRPPAAIGQPGVSFWPAGDQPQSPGRRRNTRPKRDPQQVRNVSEAVAVKRRPRETWTCAGNGPVACAMCRSLGPRCPPRAGRDLARR